MFARESWYYQSKLAHLDKQRAMQIKEFHDDIDDTLGHKKLAPMLGANKKKVLRVMKNMVSKLEKGARNITTMARLMWLSHQGLCCSTQINKTNLITSC